MSVSSEDFNFVADFLRRRSAISLAPGKEYLIESRLGPLARDIGFADVGALIVALRRPVVDSQVCDRVVEAMTTNETSFFRDHHPFAALRSELVPRAMERNAGSRRLSVWSAASSTGQELYSIAMLLDAHFPALSGWDVDLLGTDLCTKVLDRARAGRFSPLEVSRGLPAPMLADYFSRTGDSYVVTERLRSWCRFEHINLAEPWQRLPTFDVVFCRNVLIYFDLPVRQQILARIQRQIAPGGCLVLGASETTLGVVDGYHAARVGDSTVYRVAA